MLSVIYGKKPSEKKLQQSIGTGHELFRPFLGLLAAKLGAEFVDQGHDFGVALVLGDVGGVLRHILECCHYLWVLENENA